MRSGALISAAVLALAACTGAAGAEAAAPARDVRPNVVFILIDALRADHLSCYGYERETSPNIDAFAKEAWVFKNNRAQSSYTRTSMTSVFTSRYTSDASLLASAEVPGEEVLAEALGASGYFNVAIQANPQMKEEWGYGRGFDKYRMIRPEGHTVPLDQNWWLAGAPTNMFYSDAERLAEVFDEVIGNQKQKRLFIFVHFMDVHEPYIPPEEHQVFSSEPLSIQEAAELSGRFIRSKDKNLKEKAMELYDGEIHFCDAAVGGMLETLRKEGLYENTVVIIASDHGEEFLEHGNTRHSNGLYEEVLWTPLLVRMPGKRPLVWEQLTRNVDIAPTIFECTDLAPAWQDIDGVSLIDVVERGARPEASVARLYLDNNRTVRYWSSLQRGPLKYIDSHVPNFSFEELFDLSSDPGEEEDLSGKRPDDVERLKGELEKAHGGERVRPEVTPDEKTRRELQTLGYL